MLVQHSQKKLLILRLIACSLLAGIGILIMTVVAVSGAGNRDIVSDWAAGRLLVEHRNPYDVAAVLVLEIDAGCTATRVQLARNLPLSLSLFLSLGLLPFQVAALAWTLFLLTCLD